MGGPVQQSSTASHFDHSGTTGGSADASMSKWLQSTGLRPFSSSTTSSSVDTRPLSNQLSHDSAKHANLEDRQKLFRLMRSISGGVDRNNEIYSPPRYDGSRRNGGISSPELRNELGGILDLQSIDDTELLSEVSAIHEPFETSPFVAITETGYEDEPEVLWPGKKLRNKQKMQYDNSPIRASVLEKDFPGKDVSGGLARIKVVVRKRPLNKKEIARKEEDIVTIDNNGSSLSVHEPKLKVDLTAYVEKHDFVFDAVLDDYVSNDEVYRVTIQPIIPTVFQNTKATCFAYGQTGSGKTFTMQPLPLRACQEVLDLMQHPAYRNEGLQLWLSFFEIYGGKLYDLLNDRRKLCMREDGRQQVCIVGLKEFPVSDVEIVKEFIEKGNASRSTGSTGANEESSRSHAILQLVIKKHSNKKDERVGKLVGKFSFIDLAGSERGADTTDNDRQTRIEGAEINKSLLALKECIRALDNEQGHIPFRGSKLTEVLRDSFVGDSRTVMISCISPNAGSCEHTLNTLRYADRVKGLSKNSSLKRDPSPNMGIQIQRDSTTVIFSNEMDNANDLRISESSKRVDEQSIHVAQQENWPYQQGVTSQVDSDRYRNVAKEQVSYLNYQYDFTNEQGTRQRTIKDEKLDKYEPSDAKHNNITVREGRLPSKDDVIPRDSKLTQKDAIDPISQNQYYDHISAILEEEEDLIAAHRLEVEDTMELVREEMKLLTEVDQPGSRIDLYVSQLSHLLSRKAAGIVNLQARLARFQQHLKEQEILSRNMNNIQ